MKNWKNKYDLVGSFSEGRACVGKDGREGHVNKNGKVTTPIKYDFVGSFSEGRACVEKDRKFGHVDLDGKVTWD